MILAVVIASSAFLVHTHTGFERNDFLSSDEAAFLRNSMRFDLDLTNLRVEGENYHPFFGFLVQNIVLRITGTDYILMWTQNYVLFAVVAFLMMRLSLLLTGRYFAALPAIILLILDPTFIREFFIGLRVIYHTNIILSLITLILMLNFIQERRISTLSLFIGVSTLNILTIETGQFLYAISLLTIAFFTTDKESWRQPFNRFKRYIGEHGKTQRDWLIRALSINAAVMTILAISRLYMGQNIFQPGDTPTRLLIALLTIIIVSIILNTFSKGETRYKTSTYSLLSASIIQISVLITISLFSDFPERALTYLIPIVFITAMSALYNTISNLIKKNKVLKGTSLTTAFLIILIGSVYLQAPQLSEEVDSIREEKMHLQDFSEMVGLLTEDKDHLSYSLAFRSYNTKDDLLLEDSSLIETDKLSIRDSYTYKIVNLHGMTEFKMILEKDIEDRFWDRIDVGLECEKTNETEYHKLLDCIVIQ